MHSPIKIQNSQINTNHLPTYTHNVRHTVRSYTHMHNTLGHFLVLLGLAALRSTLRRPRKAVSLLALHRVRPASLPLS